MSVSFDGTHEVALSRMVKGTMRVSTEGEGFTDLTHSLKRWLREAGARDGLLLLFLRHTSASLTIQENADPAVQADLLTAFERLAPQDVGYIHGSEGPDDMPAHIRTMLTEVSLAVPVEAGRLALGTWQGVFLIEHRARPHNRSVQLVYFGA